MGRYLPLPFSQPLFTFATLHSIRYACLRSSLPTAMGNPTTTVLQEILDLSLSIQAVTKKSSTGAHEVPQHSPFPCLFTLPPIPDPTIELRAIGLSNRAVSVLADFFHSKCDLFRYQVENILRDKMSTYLSQGKSTEMHAAIQHAVSNLYTKTIAGLQSDLLSRAKHRLAGAQPLLDAVKPTKPSFNHVRSIFFVVHAVLKTWK